VPIIANEDLPKSAGAAPGLETRVLLGKEHGSQCLYIEEVSVAPDARIPAASTRTPKWRSSSRKGCSTRCSAASG
jgi:hypothetical protein